MNKSIWVLLFCLLAVIIFSKALSYPFFQDDFFTLATAKVESLADWKKLVMLQPGTIYYRPLGIQVYFALVQKFVGRNPLYFHLISFAVHLLNVILVYLLSKKLGKSDEITRLTALFYATSPLHYFWLGWAVNFSYGLLTAWVLLGILAMTSNKLIVSVLYGILAVMTNEIGIVFPILVWMVMWRLNKMNKKRNFKKLLYVGILIFGVLGYSAIRWHWGLKTESDYRISGFSLFTNLRWYGLWILGWSDIVRDHITKIAIFRKEFINSFPEVVVVYFIELLFLGILILNYFRGKWRLKTVWKDLTWGILWATVSLSPILFFSQHLYSHYAVLASLGIYWLIAKMLSEKGRLVRGIAIVVWFMVVTVTMRLNYLVSWMGDHARYSQNIQATLSRNYPILPKDKMIYVVSVGYQKAEIILAGGYGLNYLYGIDPQLVVYTNKITEIPQIKSLGKDEKMLSLDEIEAVAQKNNFFIIRL